MNKYIIPIAVCSLAGVLFTFAKQRFQNKKQKKPNTHKTETMEEPEDEQPIMMEDRLLYEEDLIDRDEYSLIVRRPQYNPDIDLLRYEILLNLNKGTNYEGVVKIKTVSYKKNGNKSHLYIDYNGRAILYVAVNGRRLDEEEAIYNKQQVLIKKQLLYKQENNIELIFANKYAFIGEGLSSYFPLEDNRYSLKGQVIYTKNSNNKISKVLPCLNVLNPCEVKLDILHPNNFEAFSNTPRSLVRMTDRQDYPFYGFFFQANQGKLTKSLRLSGSFMENTSSIRSYEEVMKSNTQFYEARLATIHDFFVLCSHISQVRPTNSTAQEKDLLIRYFAKQNLSRKAGALLNILHFQIIDIVSRIEKYQEEKRIDLKCHHKIDLFFVDDIKVQGDFYIGSILLNQTTIQRGVCDRRMYYLLCRAFVGMGLLEKRRHELLTMQGKIRLHEMTAEIFPECLDFLYVKQKEYEPIRENCLRISLKKSIKNDLDFWFLEYYEKEFRYFVRKLDEEKVSKHVQNLLKNIRRMSTDEYWTQLIVMHSFVDANVIEVLIKIGIREKGIPTREAELSYAKEHFLKSKHYLKFFSNEEIQNDLKKFIDLKSFGLEQRLPFIKMKERYLDALDQKMQKYVSIKQNRLQVKNLYEQFKRYNQSRNFHHFSALRRQIKRIKVLAKESIKEERRQLQCCLSTWKLLRKLLIFPQEESIYHLVNMLEKMKEEIIIQ